MSCRGYHFPMGPFQTSVDVTAPPPPDRASTAGRQHSDGIPPSARVRLSLIGPLLIGCWRVIADRIGIVASRFGVRTTAQHFHVRYCNGGTSNFGPNQLHGYYISYT
jgi:hypothetical protein